MLTKDVTAQYTKHKHKTKAPKIISTMAKLDKSSDSSSGFAAAAAAAADADAACASGVAQVQSSK